MIISYKQTKTVPSSIFGGLELAVESAVNLPHAISTKKKKCIFHALAHVVVPCPKDAIMEGYFTFST